MDKQTATDVKCLLLPITGGYLLVPNTLVAEIVVSQKVLPAENQAQWMAGIVQWRDQELPLISYEALRGIEEAPRVEKGSRYVVLHAINSEGRYAYYAVLIQGIPHLMLVTRNKINNDSAHSQTDQYVASYVDIEGTQAVIPDIDALEVLLHNLG